MSAAAFDGQRAAAVSRRGSGLRFLALDVRGPVLVRIMGRDQRCKWTNAAWHEFTGRDKRKALGEGWLEDVHPEDRPRCAEARSRQAEAGQLVQVEYRLRRKGGEYGWVLEIGTPRMSARGARGGYVGMAIEITDRKRAETYLLLQYSIARVLSQVKALEEAAAPLLKALCENLGWEVGELWSVDSRARALQRVHVFGGPSVDLESASEDPPKENFAPGRGLFGRVVQSGQPAWIPDINGDQEGGREALVRGASLRGAFYLPVAVRGEIVAILRVFSTRIRERDDAVLEFMEAVSAQVGQFLDRLQSEQRIREFEVRKSAILDASLDAVITVDHGGAVVEFNSAAEQLFGYAREQVLGKPLVDLIVPPRLREQALIGFAACRHAAEDELRGKRFDSFAMRSDGSEFPVEVALVPLMPGVQPRLTMYVCDSTARRRAEQEIRDYQKRLRALMTDLLLTEEQERRRLAVDVHDGLSQTIALVQLKLSAIRNSADASLAAALDEILALISKANLSARAISLELSPPMLHDLGLEPALQWLVEHISSRYGVEIELEDDGLPKPADERTRVILFRSIRELLIIAAKHAGARRVRVRLGREGNGLDAAVEDDGVGLAADALENRGTGLFSIRERLNHVGGSMRIESTPGRGTTVRLRAPLVNGQST